MFLCQYGLFVCITDIRLRSVVFGLDVVAFWEEMSQSQHTGKLHGHFLAVLSQVSS